jgi:hypothetical protein
VLGTCCGTPLLLNPKITIAKHVALIALLALVALAVIAGLAALAGFAALVTLTDLAALFVIASLAVIASLSALVTLADDAALAALTFVMLLFLVRCRLPKLPLLLLPPLQLPLPPHRGLPGDVPTTPLRMMPSS